MQKDGTKVVALDSGMMIITMRIILNVVQSVIPVIG